MNTDPKKNFKNIDKVFFESIAKEFGTPCFVYDENSISENYNQIKNVFAQEKRNIFYSVKANSSLSILKLLYDLGSGFDIVSMGELDRVLKIGADPKKIIYSGVGKSEDDIKRSIEEGIYCINVESFSELERINKISSELKKTAPVAIRVNPNIDPGSHEYISTGLEETKFGINLKNMMDAFIYASEQKHIDLLGIDYHIGSQIETIEPFLKAISSVAQIIEELKNKNIHIQLIDMGGGLGISYNNEKVPTLNDFGKEINIAIKDNNLENYNIILELGRSIVGNSGFLLTKVEYIKKDSEKNYVIVDAGMDNLIRPALYGAVHKIDCVSEERNNKEELLCDVVGPVCECADFLGKDIKLKVEQGDIVVVYSCGAYAASMASNYNTRPKPAEILIKNGKPIQISKKETIDDLLKRELII